MVGTNGHNSVFGTKLRLEVAPEESVHLLVILAFEQLQMLDDADCRRYALVLQDVEQYVAVIIKGLSTTVGIQRQSLCVGRTAGQYRYNDISDLAQIQQVLMVATTGNEREIFLH